MTLSNKRSRQTCLRGDGTTGLRRQAPVGRSAALLVTFFLSLAGCVTQGTHQELATERDDLVTQNTGLEEKLANARASNESLSGELANLLEDFEDVRISRDQLQGRVAALSVQEQLLAEELAVVERDLFRERSEVTILTSTYTNLVTELESELASGQIEIEQLREGLRVKLSDEILFATGSAVLDGIGQEVLARVAAQLIGLEHSVEVQGHTDDRPIFGKLAKRYPTNWELAGARAARVARLLQDQGVEGDRLVVTSYGEFRPVVSNETEEGRWLNRRIEIRLLPLEGPVDSDSVAEVTGEAAPEPGAAQVPAAPAEDVEPRAEPISDDG